MEERCPEIPDPHREIQKSHSWYIPKGAEGNCPHKDLYTHVHSSTADNNKNWKSIQNPSLGRGIDKMWYIHAVEYSSAIKRDGVVMYTTAQMNLSSILSEENQTQGGRSVLGTQGPAEARLGGAGSSGGGDTRYPALDLTGLSVFSHLGIGHLVPEGLW